MKVITQRVNVTCLNHELYECDEEQTNLMYLSALKCSFEAFSGRESAPSIHACKGEESSKE